VNSHLSKETNFKSIERVYQLQISRRISNEFSIVMQCISSYWIQSAGKID